MFWVDQWVGEIPLKERFPRLFFVSSQKQNYITDMGIWDDGVWNWRFEWRRRLFSWEEHMVGDLLLAITQHSLIERVEDDWLGSFDSSSSFSVSSFSLQVFKKSFGASTEWIQGRKAWRGLASPLAELLMWFILQGRLNIKERLRRLNCLNSNDSRCMFCVNVVESLEHLFFTYSVSWQV